MNPRTRFKLIFGIMTVAAITVCLLAIRLANHSLTAAGAMRLRCADGDYAWVSNNKIITFLTKTSSVPARYDPNTRSTVVTVTAEVADIASGNRSALTGFQSVLQDAQKDDVTHWSASPDGKRLIFGPVDPGRYWDDGSTPFSVWTFASNTQQTIDTDEYVGINYSVQSLEWMPDSRLLLLAKNGDGSAAALYNTESADDSAVAIPLALNAPFAVGVTPNNFLIYTDILRSKPSGTTIYSQDIVHSQSLPNKYTPILPRGASVNELSLSPQGNRLAWITSSLYSPPGYKYTLKMAPWLAKKIAPYPVVSIYISRLDGTDMRLLGMENNPPNNPPNSSGEAISNVRWRPDGKFLSFRWRRGVYLVPAE